MINLAEKLLKIKQTFNDGHLFSKDDLASLYKRNLPSFASKLPYAGYDNESQTFILEDLISRAVVFTISPIATEGKTGGQLAAMRDAVADLYSEFEERERSRGQWCIQEFTYEDNSVEAIVNKMRDYVVPHAKGSVFTESYLKMMARHYRSISKDTGLYEDSEVTLRPWRFKTPRTKFIIYRRQSKSDIKAMNAGKHSPTTEITDLVKTLSVKFKQAGINFSVDDDADLFGWLFKFFNPNPELNNFSSKDEYYGKMCDVDGDLLIGPDLCEALLSEPPESNTDDNCWYFNNAPIRFLRFSGLRKKPRVGALTGEVEEGEGASKTTFCAMDSLPSNAILTKTTVIEPQIVYDNKFDKVGDNSRGGGKDAKKQQRNLRELDSLLQHGGNKVSVTMGVYITGKDLNELSDNQRTTITTLNNNNLLVYKDAIDGLSLDSFINHLPMNFRPEQDNGMYLRSMWAQHNANLCFAFGRGEGTGNPCLNFFNRGGSPVFIDPISKQDKANNSFGFIAGPAGAGKSATITQIVYSLMAMKRPKLFLMEYGDSFSLAAKDWKKKGLKVNYFRVMPDTAPNLAPFANIDNILSGTSLSEEDLIENFKEELELTEEELNEELNSDSDQGEESAQSDTEKANAQGDALSELEMILLLMVTGSEDAEMARLTRADRAILRKALIETAKRQRRKGFENGKGRAEPTVTSDIQQTLFDFAKDESMNLSSTKREHLFEMATSLDSFTTGINATLFNQPGEGWKDADITVFNFGLLSSDANVAQLNVAFLSLMQHINNLSEALQSSPVDIVSITDEGHLFLNNNILGKILTRVVKTARKLGHIPFFATQDLADLSGESQKVLNNIEWYYCLNFGLEEALKVQKIKNLTDEDVHLMVSTRKLDRCYTEGVILTKKHRILVRSSPPSLLLALGMTDSSEKTEREQVMAELGTNDELAAVYEISNRIDKERGIEGRLEYEFGDVA